MSRERKTRRGLAAADKRTRTAVARLGGLSQPLEAKRRGGRNSHKNNR